MVKQPRTPLNISFCTESDVETTSCHSSDNNQNYFNEKPEKFPFHSDHMIHPKISSIPKINSFLNSNIYIKHRIHDNKIFIEDLVPKEKVTNENKFFNPSFKNTNYNVFTRLINQHYQQQIDKLSLTKKTPIKVSFLNNNI